MIFMIYGTDIGEIYATFVILEFQGPSVPLRNSSPCGGLARFAHTVFRFARSLTLEILDFVHRDTERHASFLYLEEVNPFILRNFKEEGVQAFI